MPGLSLIQRDWSHPIIEMRSSLESPQTPLSYPAEWLLDIFNGGRTDSGIRVSELTALQTSTVLTCVDLISGAIGSLDCHVYERTLSENGRAKHRIAYDHHLYDLISSEPNSEMSRQTSFKAFLCHCLLWGNGYQEIQRDAANNVLALWPRNPAKTRPRRLTQFLHLEPVAWRPYAVNLPAGTLVFQTTDGMDEWDGSESDARQSPPRIIPAQDMVAVPGIALDGRIGQSTVWLARQTIGIALAMEKFGSKYFANFAKPGGILEIPNAVRKEDRDLARQSWMESQGGENAHRVAVMPPGFKWTPISNNPSDSQTIETRAYTRNEICAIYHVPPHMAGETEKAGKSNSEQQAQEFIQYTLKPWMSALRLELKRKLFPHKGIGRTPRNNYYVDFDTSEMVRPDAAAREKFYASGSQWRYLCPNDVRAYEKLNPIEEPWAEEFTMPVNMTMATTPIDPNHQDGMGEGQKPGKASKAIPEAPKDSVFLRMFADAFERVLARETRDFEAFRSIFEPLFLCLRDSARQEAIVEFSCECATTRETDKFIADYMWSFQKRCASWTAATEVPVLHEFNQFRKSVRVAAFREVAAVKARETPVV